MLETWPSCGMHLYPYLHRTVVAPPLSVVKCFWEVFVWGSCRARVCAGVGGVFSVGVSCVRVTSWLFYMYLYRYRHTEYAERGRNTVFYVFLACFVKTLTLNMCVFCTQGSPGSIRHSHSRGCVTGIREYVFNAYASISLSISLFIYPGSIWLFRQTSGAVRRRWHHHHATYIYTPFVHVYKSIALPIPLPLYIYVYVSLCILSIYIVRLPFIYCG